MRALILFVLIFSSCESIREATNRGEDNDDNIMVADEPEQAAEVSNGPTGAQRFFRAFGAALQGAGSGLSNAGNHRTYNCRSDGFGGYNCQ